MSRLSSTAVFSLPQSMLVLGRYSRPILPVRRLRLHHRLRMAAAPASTSASAPAPAPQKPGKGAAAKAPPSSSTLDPFSDPTTPGEKKVLQSFEHAHFSAYSPSAVESSWYQWWEKSGFFKPQSQPNAAPADSSNSFVIPLPPPNVTGDLHCGHALANTIQDTLVRWNRMRGVPTLWVPGCDHAGISTQSVVEKMLWKKEKKTRIELGREAFTKLVWDWKDAYHQRINNAQRLMGGSMDWSREAFTMDENCTRATMQAFCTLHDEGLIYRSDRLVNWCTNLQTALSSLEVDNKEIPGRTLLDVPGYERKVAFGEMTYFKYPIDGTDLFVEVATTRPETMLGDTGIAVHPDDKRYSHLVGKYARHPFTDRLLKIVADEYVDPELGTGAVKLTPAHDYNDYQLGKRHGLDFINILNGDGTMNENVGPTFQGQKRFDVRYQIVEELTKLGLFVKKESHAMTIPLCEKTRDVIEPLMKKQWWVKMADMAAEGLKVVEEGKIKILPESAEKSYKRWLSGINDWCISRQLWWGHRIPAYRVVLEGQDASVEDDEAHWIVGRTPDEAQAKAASAFPGKQFTLEQDPDCLDTWVSSGLWPMAILGWPAKTPDLEQFFPNSLLETGWDILFFWVARMIMLSLKLTGEVPFREVYCHSLVRDIEGRKMSKSLGNVIDPLDIINGIDLNALHAKLLVGNLKETEIARATKYQKTAFPGGIPECGADALRFTLLSYTTGGGDINFDIKVMAAYRRFCNKIWQASKYVMGRLPENFKPVANLDVVSLSTPEKWILHCMNSAVRDLNAALAAREFSKSTQIAHKFFYDELCDVFIEHSKSLLTSGTASEQDSVQQTLHRALDVALRLLHPFMPFITEELWQRLPRAPYENAASVPESIMVAPFPTSDDSLYFPAEAESYELSLQCTRAIRSLAAEYNVKTGGVAFVKAVDATSNASIAPQMTSIKTLCGKVLSDLSLLGPEDAVPTGCAVFVLTNSIHLFLQVADAISDVDAAIKKVQVKLQKKQVVVKKQKELIARDGFDKSSEVVQTAEKSKLEEANTAVNNYERTIEEFEKLKLKA
ncbi:tRNA synthetases class I-domain-containing protein [Xylaria bambusicola]|uniref:tRNA synthetases class I-domain-containing protein n=1 Tax=Xylaria bambusicola TaxID=326684 RepID=UPI0020076324|nr:tRNA synthetases class I-domain-containing protein [Xylaria bambusicola]KAI0503344.1 tRNA synthetases class I-domain-containing protein [Xylaria bambusicola]